MRERVLKNVIRQLCYDFAETLIVGIKESEDEFPYTLSCITFICELKERGIRASLRDVIENPELLDNMYRELSDYLAK